MNIHFVVCTKNIRRLQARIDESVVPMLKFRDILIEHFVNPVGKIHSFDFDPELGRYITS